MKRLGVVAAAAAAVITACLAPSVAGAAAPIPVPGVKPGDRLYHPSGLFGVVVPAPGRGVLAELLRENGAISLEVETTEDGRVYLAPETVDTGATGGAAPCNNNAYALWGDPWGKWRKWDPFWHPITWYVRQSQIPSYLSVTNTISALQDAAATWEIERNGDCGFGRVLGQGELWQTYGGDTNVGTNMDPATRLCTTPDYINVVSWGSWVPGFLAFACATTQNVEVEPGFNEIIDADIRFNSGNYTFWNTLSTCTGTKYMTRAVAAHEFGHVFGLWHVDEGNSGLLTMSTAINGPCQESEYTLGLGDMLGIEAIYNR